MRTHKRVTLILALTTTMLMPAAAQESGTNAPPLSNTRLASCLVKITADPDVIPLNPGTVESLLYTSSVGLKAAREVLDIETPDNIHDLIEVQWLDASPAGAGSPEDMSQAYDRDMMAQYQEIYGAEYLKQMGIQPDEKKETDRGGRTVRAPRRDIRVTRGLDRAGGPRVGLDGVQTVTLQLVVHLPEDVRPAAREFMTEITDRLRVTLIDTYQDYEEQLHMLLHSTERQRYETALKLEMSRGRSPEQAALEKQLDTTVDLSAIGMETPLEEAFQVLSHSVEPPLPLVVLWRDLQENAFLDPSSPVEMKGLPSVRLGTALDILLKAVSGGSYELSYRLERGAIVVGVRGVSQESAGDRSKVEVDVRSLSDYRNMLADKIRGLELELAGMQARQDAIQRQIAETRKIAETQLAEDAITKELRRIIEINEVNLATLHKQVDSGRASTADLAQANENLARARIELARRQEELARQAGGGQLENLTREISTMAIETAQKQAELVLLKRQLQETQQQLAQATAFDPQAARIRLTQDTMSVLERRIAELQVRLANLQQPTLTVIGAN